MASRRAATNLFSRASGPVAAAPALPIRVPSSATRLASRPYSSLPAQQTRKAPTFLSPIQQQQVRIRATTGPNCATAVKRAYYSTESGDKPSKIWDFEAVQKLASSPDKSVVLVDVREPHELQETGKIPGAINIPVTSAPDSFHITDAEFEDRFGRPRPPRDAEVVFYCRAGVRCRAAAGLARDAGWSKLAYMVPAKGREIARLEKDGYLSCLVAAVAVVSMTKDATVVCIFAHSSSRSLA
ncbi:hypothetical protein VTJ49DRAFT_5900 [Mycothermus thermophilus]|uniref:Rhodanese domain-containing protein n=1 Tax=Humicola insolens TaxID=85995 RepID=A0ABR3V2B5_HUMIN